MSELARTTFQDTFGGTPEHRPDDMALFLQRDLGPEQLGRELCDGSLAYWLALDGARPTGYLKLRWHHREPGVPGDDPGELCRLYAVRESHGSGLGRALLELAFEQARLHGHDVIWLGVWEKNARARAFYAKNGFVECGSHPFLFGTDLQTDLLMQRPLA